MSVNPEGVVAIPSEERKRLEEMGEARVRLVFNTNGFGSSNRIYAGKWLAELERFNERAMRRSRLSRRV
jgi:hypothetical protein